MARLTDDRGRFVKRAIPAASRRAIANSHGCAPLSSIEAACHYCGAAGRIHWMTASWVWFEGLEMDHKKPEFLGGDSSPSNLVLACRPCNRSKGYRNA